MSEVFSLTDIMIDKLEKPFAQRFFTLSFAPSPKPSVVLFITFFIAKYMENNL